MLTQNAERIFSGMHRIIDCMHGVLNNLKFSWKQLYTAHIRECSVILENVADYTSRLSTFFGMAGTHHDINLLSHFSMFARLDEEHASVINYEINGNTYEKGTIYPMISIHHIC
jgi:hypothetical protein